jgi:uncharacterized protein (DUF305 family)
MVKGVSLTTHHDEPAPDRASETGTDEDDPTGPATGDAGGPGDAPGRGGVGGEGGAEVELDDGPAASGLSWPRVAVLGAALLFFGFATATFLGGDRPPGADSIDVGFYQDMIAHHDQALRMASLELANGSDPVVKGFAREVITFQSYEIGVMERTLAEWGYDRADRSDVAMAWMGMPTPLDRMFGMATEDEIDALADSEGSAADAMFLDLMAEHHLGGLHMSEAAGRETRSDHVRELANRMTRNQSIEINEYAMTAEREGLPVEIRRVPIPDEGGRGG